MKRFLWIAILPLLLTSVASHAVVVPLETCPADAKYNPNYFSDSSGKVRFITAPDKEYLFQLPPGSAYADVVETYRPTQMAADLAVFRQIASAIVGGKFAAVAPKCYRYKPTLERAILTIKPLDNNEKAVDNLGTATFIVGPEEHLWLSADVGLTSINQLTMGTNNTPVLKSKPASFYIGFNYKFGDVFQDYGFRTSDFWQNISFKTMIHASSTPSDSMGFGLSYSNAHIFGYGPFTIFGSHIWTRNDPSVTNAPKAYSGANVFGLSFDISSGLSWVK